MAKSGVLDNPHVGSAPPNILYIGRVWHEITSAGLYICSWIWNGTYWLSLQIFAHHFTTALVTTVANVIYPLDPGFNIFLTNAIATIQSNVLATATTNWGWSVARINSAGTATTIATANNIGQAANAWQTFKTTINQHVNLATVGAVGLRLLETRTGTISKAGSVGFEYRRVRI